MVIGTQFASDLTAGLEQGLMVGVDGIDFPEFGQAHFGGYLAQIVADEVNDGVMFGYFFFIVEQLILGIGYRSIDGAFHGVGINVVFFDPHKTLG